MKTCSRKLLIARKMNPSKDRSNINFPKMPNGLIFDIKRYAINDGPGIRMTVFFKGCPLSCTWCHNPESQSRRVQKMYSANKCIGSQDCVKACPNQALTLTPDGIVTDMEACQLEPILIIWDLLPMKYPPETTGTPLTIILYHPLPLPQQIPSLSSILKVYVPGGRHLDIVLVW